MAALSGRPPAPRPAHRSALVAGALVGLGTVAIWWSDPNRATEAHPPQVVALGAGVVAIALGVLLLGPIALRVAGRAARRLPVTGRLAVRDLARFQARSGMALGAVSLAVGIPIAIVITSAAGEAGAAEGNLSDRDLLLRIDDAKEGMVPEASADELEAMAAQVDVLAGGLGDAAVVRLDMAIEPGSTPPPGLDARPGVASDTHSTRTRGAASSRTSPRPSCSTTSESMGKRSLASTSSPCARSRWCSSPKRTGPAPRPCPDGRRSR